MYNYLSCMSADNSIDLQLILMQQCCDHPYLVDQSLQSTLTKDRPITDILDIGVRSCGKLLLLDKLTECSNRSRCSNRSFAGEMSMVSCFLCSLEWREYYLSLKFLQPLIFNYFPTLWLPVQFLSFFQIFQEGI